MLGETAFQQMRRQDLKDLVWTMRSQIQFYRIVYNQDEVDNLLQQEDPNMIKFLNSSLQEM